MRLIEDKVILEALCSAADGDTATIDAFMELVDGLPSVDAVEVVRCRDCKYAEPYKRMAGETGYYCHCKYSVFEYADKRKYTPVRESGDFCSYGERKEDKQ